jgi:hypothetical protein
MFIQVYLFLFWYYLIAPKPIHVHKAWSTHIVTWQRIRSSIISPLASLICIHTEEKANVREE